MLTSLPMQTQCHLLCQTYLKLTTSLLALNIFYWSNWGEKCSAWAAHWGGYVWNESVDVGLPLPFFFPVVFCHNFV